MHEVPPGATATCTSQSGGYFFFFEMCDIIHPGVLLAVAVWLLSFSPDTFVVHTMYDIYIICIAGLYGAIFFF